jgi:hypothetical protein
MESMVKALRAEEVLRVAAGAKAAAEPARAEIRASFMIVIVGRGVLADWKSEL